MIRPLGPAEPRVGDPDSLYEVVNGVEVAKPTSTYENVLAGWLFARLHAHATAADLGRAVVEVMFDLPGQSNDRRPDVGFVSFDRWPRNRGIPRTKAWPIVPDLAVEIISPTDEMADVMEKMEEYFRAGVRSVWVILPRQERVYVYTSPTAVHILSRGDELTGDPVVPGFRLPLADLFPPPDEPAA